MDSKAFIAIIASLLLFLAWQHFYGPKPAPQSQQQGTTQGPTTTQPQSAQPSAPPVFPSAPPAQVDLSAQKTWTIADSLYKMEIVAQGAERVLFGFSTSGSK